MLIAYPEIKGFLGKNNDVGGFSGRGTEMKREMALININVHVIIRLNKSNNLKEWQIFSWSLNT